MEYVPDNLDFYNAYEREQARQEKRREKEKTREKQIDKLLEEKRAKDGRNASKGQTGTRSYWF